MRSKSSSTIVLAFAFFCAFLSVGLPYWQIPYAQVSLPNAVWGWPLLIVIVLAAVPRAACGTRFWSAALVVGASVPAAVLARIVYDTFSDPTSHNLWPFEIILAAGPGLLAGVMGALVGGLLASRSGT
jgi:hypothetical protein